MDTNLLKNNVAINGDCTQGTIIPFPGMNNGDIKDAINEKEEDIIKIVVPKGFTAKVIFEKKEELNSSLNINEDNTIEQLDLFQKNVKSIENETAYDIIKAEDIKQLDNRVSAFSNKTCKNIGEDENMKSKVLYNVLKKQLGFLISGIAFIIVSLVAISVYYRTGLYIVNPLLYIITLLMGIGWSATALISIKSNEVLRHE